MSLVCNCPTLSTAQKSRENCGRFQYCPRVLQNHSRATIASSNYISSKNMSESYKPLGLYCFSLASRFHQSLAWHNVTTLLIWFIHSLCHIRPSSEKKSKERPTVAQATYTPRGVIPYIRHIGMCRPKGYGFWAVLVWNWVWLSGERSRKLKTLFFFPATGASNWWGWKRNR